MTTAKHRLWFTTLATGLVLLALSFSLVSKGIVFADTKPYFTANGADVSAGGGTDPGCANYQSPTADQREGGILAFNRSLNGARAQYGAMSLGLIEGRGNPANDFGFASQRGSAPSGNGLSFANSGQGAFANNWGGLFGSSMCTPDYYGKLSSLSGVVSRNLATVNANDMNTLTGRVFSYTPPGGTLTINTGTVPVDADKSFFVDGNVYITNNIAYAGGYNASNVPKLAIVARGNIYVAPGVTNITGFYIAQLDTSNNRGEFWSCRVNVGSAPTPDELRNQCNQPLNVNGAVAAAKVHLLRTNSDAITGAGPAGETFNYTPEMVIGGGFFDDGTRQNSVQFDSLISLPPIF